MKKLVIALAALALGGCATSTIGTVEQTVTVDTPGVKGASCKVTGLEHGQVYVPSTPAAVTLVKRDGPFEFACEKEGFYVTSTTVQADLSGAAIANLVWLVPPAFPFGFIGTFFGLVVDGNTGALGTYPEKIAVPMELAEGGAGAETVPRTTTKGVAASLQRLSPMRIAVAVAPIRAEPEPTGSIIKLVRRGDQVDIVGSSESGWLQIGEKGKPIGWVHWTAFPVPRAMYRVGGVATAVAPTLN